MHRLIISLLTSSLLCSLLAFCGPAKKSLQGAILVNPKGEVQITPPGQKAYSFNASMIKSSKGIVGQDFLIQTGSNGQVDLQFQTGVSMRLGSNSNLKLDLTQIEAGSEKSQIQMSLNGGSIVSQNLKMHKNSNIKVTTPTMVASVRGTEFIVFDESVKKLMVEEGQVEVTKPDAPDEPVVVEEGKKVEVGDEDIAVEEMSDEEQSEVDEMSEGLDYMDEDTKNSLDSIIDSFEAEKERIHAGFQEQKEKNEQIMQAEKERQQETFQNEKERITGEGGAKSELERIKNLQ